MNRLDALIRLYSDYLDDYGRVTLYHKSLSDALNQKYDNENPHLFNGEAAILLKLNEHFGSAFQLKFKSALKLCEVTKGLHQRQPKMDQDRHLISHDEHNGIMYLCTCLDDKNTINEIINYGENHNWVYIDNNPDADLYDNLIAYASHIRQPKDRTFYRICGNQNADLFGVLNLMVGTILAALKPPEDTSGKIMAWFHFKTFELLKYPSFTIKATKWLFDWILKRKYKTDHYMEECFKIYFKDPDHPFHELIKGLK